MLIVAALYVVNATFQPFHGEGDRSVRLRVPAGADAGRIGKLLDARGVVDSATFFQLNATITGRRGGLRPGVYTLRRGMSNGAAIEALSQGPKAKVVPTIEVGVPEGLSIREAAPLVDKTPLEGSYLKAARSSRTLRKIRALGAPRRHPHAEGFLFPATYTLVDGAPARNLVDRQLAAFDENFSKVDMSYAKRKNLTRYDVLIIASMVEREAQLDRERPLVAAVIYNRLADGMTLGHRRDDPLLREQLVAAAARVRAGAPERLQHAPEPRPAADADRQPRPRVDQGRRQPGPQGLPLLRPQARRSRASTRSPRRTRSSSATCARYQASRGASPAA